MNRPFDEAKYKALLEGLEVKEILFSELQLDNEKLRIDDEFFLKKYLSAYKKIKQKPHDKLSDIISILTDYHANGSYEILRNHVEILDTIDYAYMVRSTDFEKMDFETDVKYASKSAYEYMAKTKLFGGELLINKIGNPGRVYLMPYLNRPATVGMNLFMLRLKTDSNYKEKYIWAFFNSKLGQDIIFRKINGTVPLTIDKEAVKSLYVPKVSIPFQDEIENLVTSSQEKLIRAKQTYQQAENLLLEAIGLKDFEPSKEKINVKNFSSSFLAMERIDAEFYQPKYDDIERKIKSYGNGFTLIADEYDHVNTKSKINKDAYNYIEIGDVNVGDGSASFNLIETAELPANAKYEVEKGDLLISKVRPNRGAVTIIDFDAENLIVSGAFCVLREKKDSVFSNETLKVLLRTKIYKEWFLKFNVGTQYPVIKDEDILTLPIPKIEQIIQREISEKIKESQTLKAESENLLEIAKRAVEMAIEETEEKAIKFIEECAQ